ncbi:MAG TPA: hypothetical protein VFV46_11900 [Lacibacter sp.]|nr:hypothetical protein [Lacibacter sp.]
MNSNHLQPYLQQLKQWKAEGLLSAQMETRLKEQHLPEDEIGFILNEWKRITLAQKRDAGFIWGAAGGGLMLISFLVSLVLYNQGQGFMYILYSLTLIGIGMVFKGLVDILGW